jgi:hypothetical protein
VRTARAHLRSRRGLTALALLAVATITPPGAFATVTRLPVAVRGISVRLVEVPASSLTNPLARTYITGVIAAGQSMRSKVEVANTTTKPQSISVYTAGASMRGGAFTFEEGRTQNELARWTTVSQSAVLLAPGTATVVTVDVTVPRQVSSGERYSVVWAAVDARSTAASVKLVNRVGVRMYVRVGGTAAAPRYSISRPKADRSAGGVPLVRATIRNSGKGTLALAGSLTLARGPGGLRAGPFRFTLTRPLAPGASRRVNVQLTKQLPRGPWSARLELVSGATQRVSAATITFPRLARRG